MVNLLLVVNFFSFAVFGWGYFFDFWPGNCVDFPFMISLSLVLTSCYILVIFCVLLVLGISLRHECNEGFLDWKEWWLLRFGLFW